jgi:hypothetical protein
MSIEKKILVAVFSGMLLLGCKEISFREPQPKGKRALPEIPKKLHGIYLLKATGDDAQDTLRISAKGYYIASDKKESLLGDSLVLKKYKGYYFVNINENPEWLMRVIRQEDNGDLTYMSMDTEETKFKTLLKELSQEVRVDSLVVNGEKLYQIDPTPKQLIQLIQKGYFRNTFQMKKIN